MKQTELRVVEYPYFVDPNRRRDIEAEIRNWLSEGWQVLSVQRHSSEWIVTYWR